MRLGQISVVRDASTHPFKWRGVLHLLHVANGLTCGEFALVVIAHAIYLRVWPAYSKHIIRRAVPAKMDGWITPIELNGYDLGVVPRKTAQTARRWWLRPGWNKSGLHLPDAPVPLQLRELVSEVTQGGLLLQLKPSSQPGSQLLASINVDSTKKRVRQIFKLRMERTSGGP
jgi:hypothetical protein